MSSQSSCNGRKNFIKGINSDLMKRKVNVIRKLPFVELSVGNTGRYFPCLRLMMGAFVA